MMPNRPIRWYIVFVVVVFFLNYFPSNEPEVVEHLVIALLSGASAMACFYVIDKIRERWYLPSNLPEE